VEVRSAQAFLVLAEELHFGRAAQRLHMAQPPLSRLIRKIESDLGVLLFERTTRGVSLTTEGEVLIEPARELVMQSQRISEIIRRTQGGLTGRVRLGFAGPSVGRMVGSIARRFMAERPGIACELFSSQFSHHGLEKVLDGSLDAVIGRWDFLPAEVDSIVLAQEQLLLAVPESHPLASKEKVRATDLANEPWVVLPGRGFATLPNRLNVLGITGRFVPRIVQLAPDSSTMLLLVSAHVGVALTLSGVRDNVPADGVTFLEFEPALGVVEVRLVWRRSDPSPALSALIAVAQRDAAEL